jgi:2-oxoglutarate dehydrogenase complex dehydrogenase (E1) component-like enzyme
MERRALKEVLYGGVEEMMSNTRYYYTSTIGIQFNHWTEEGKQALSEYIELLSHQIKKCQIEEDLKRSKEMVLNELTKGK